MVEENRAARFKLVLINKGEDRYIMLRANTRGNNGMIVVNDLFQSTNTHGSTAEIINLATLLLQKL